jgi:tetraacyldisaccharide 4'-kinase
LSTVSGAWTIRLQAAWSSRGALASLLLPVALLFSWASSVRRSLYRFGALRAHTLTVPVVVVGNLVAGGAGKTPTVMAIVALLRERGYTPGIVSRGYGRQRADLVSLSAKTPVKDCGDEPLLMHLRTRAPVVVGRDRVAAGRELLLRHPEANVIVSDDGLQHLQLARDVQVLVFDERGAGNGWPLPAGPLREPMPSAVPPRSLVVYNARAPSTALPGVVAHRALRGAVALDDWWRGTRASEIALQALQGRPLLAAAGLARPQRFFDMLGAAGLNVRQMPLPDHYDFSTLPWPPQAEEVIVTEKDAVKLRPERMSGTRVWVAALDFDLGAEFGAALTDLLPPPSTVQRANAHGSTTA